ncbi:branched-chain amino acid ABC transporter permease [uncultured Microbacterium sp.]|uniref:branched-chain amino acid ABC transporter permease n=1 Tax=uncultured Microbacterium sp. TaxID=191216 RepID=UPI0035CAB843
MIDGSVILSGVLVGGLYAIVALGLTLVFGVMRLVNIAHGDIIVLGAYASMLVVTVLGWDPLVSLVAVVPLMFLIAYPVQRYVLTGLLRKGEEPPIVATFGISLLISAALVLAFTGNAQSLAAPYALQGMNLFGVTVRVSDVIAFVIGVVLVVAVNLWMKRSRYGAALRAASSDPQTAATMGINVNRLYAVTFAAAAAFAAVAGVLIGIGYGFTPTTTGFSFVLIGFTVVVLGGIGNVMGALWGGLALGLIQSVGSAIVGSEYRDFLIYAAFLVVLLVKPTLHRVVSGIQGMRAERLVLKEAK